MSGKKDTLPCDIVMWARLLAMFHCCPNIQHRPLIPKTHKPPQLVSLVEDQKTVSSTAIMKPIVIWGYTNHLPPSG